MHRYRSSQFAFLATYVAAGIGVAALIRPSEIYVLSTICVLLMLRLAHPLIRLRSAGKPWPGELMIWLASGVLIGLAGAMVTALAGPAFDSLDSWIKNIADKKPEATWTGTVLAVVLTAVIERFMREKTPGPLTDRVPSKHFRGEELTYEEYCEFCEGYVGALLAWVKEEDHEWRDDHFVSLEAQVTVERGGAPRILKNLINAISAVRSERMMLVLGEPGSGKSVSLRRLVRMLAARAQQSGVIPLYVNLREYPAEQEVTTQGIRKFIEANVSQHLQGPGQSLFTKRSDGRSILDVLESQGRVFYVLDSFDEMPQVLDVDDRSTRHRQISAELSNFLTREVSRCRAVLASRLYRRPREIPAIELKVQPFRESQVRKALKIRLKDRGIDYQAYIASLFRDAPQLVPASTNPLTAGLLASYARRHPVDYLPSSLFQVFEDEVRDRLKREAASFGEQGFTIDQAYMTLISIVTLVHAGDRTSLELDIETIAEMLVSTKRIASRDACVDLLESYAKAGLLRKCKGRSTVSFVHRRFAEYLIANKMRLEIASGTGEPSDEKIQELATKIREDHSERESLLMFVSVAPQTFRQRIAQTCWAQTKQDIQLIAVRDPIASRRAVHVLRFFREAYLGDSDAIEPIRDELTVLLDQMLSSDDLLAAKIAAEAIPIASSDDHTELLEAAFETESPMVAQSALIASRHLGKIDRGIRRNIGNHVLALTPSRMISEFHDHVFSLSLSDSLRVVRAFFMYESLMMMFTAMMVMFSILLFPMAMMTGDPAAITILYSYLCAIS